MTMRHRIECSSRPIPCMVDLPLRDRGVEPRIRSRPRASRHRFRVPVVLCNLPRLDRVDGEELPRHRYVRAYAADWQLAMMDIELDERLILPLTSADTALPVASYWHMRDRQGPFLEGRRDIELEVQFGREVEGTVDDLLDEFRPATNLPVGLSSSSSHLERLSQSKVKRRRERGETRVDSHHSLSNAQTRYRPA